MKRFRLIAILLTLLGLIGAGVYFAVNYFRPQVAGLFIESNPAATVFINGEQVGRTPFDEKLPAGEVIVKLVPDSFDTPLVPFETKITLTSGVKTIINRNFASTLDESSGEVLAFEKAADSQVGLSVVSVPEVTQIAVDGQILGFAPFKTSAIEPGDHILKLSAPGFIAKEIGITTYEGYNLTAFVKLAVDPESEEEPVEEPSQSDIEVEILETPTGFLRVRSEPSTLGEEVGQVEPGDIYPVLEEDPETGWYKIEFEDAQGEKIEGWVSGEYAKVVEAESET